MITTYTVVLRTDYRIIIEYRRIFDQVCETSQGYTKRSQKEEEKED
jgi:hypothetical protein